MNSSVTHHRSLRGLLGLALLTVAAGMFAHASTAHGASSDQNSGANSPGEESPQKDVPSGLSNKRSPSAASKSGGRVSTAEAAEWRSRRAAGKWVSSASEVARPTGKSTNSKAPPKKVASARETARKPAPIVFIAGKTESGSAEDDAPASTPSTKSTHSDETHPHTDASVPLEEKHSGTHEAGDSRDSSSIDIKDPSDSHDQPQFFDAPLLQTPDIPADETPDGSPVTSATERFKQLLLRKQSELDNPLPSGDSSHGDAHHDAEKSPVRNKSSISSLPLSIEEDLKSDDLLRREKAARFLKLREQLLQLKSRNRVPREEKHTAPHVADDAHAPNASSTMEDAHPALEENHSDHDAASSSHMAEPAPDKHSSAPNEHQEHPAEHAEDAQTTHNDSHQGTASDPHDSHAAESHTDEAHNDAGHEASHEAGHEEGAMTHEDGDPTAHESGEGTTAQMVGSIPDPIDRVSLGNNLYALGEYPAAHKAYLSVIPEELSAEQQFWTEFQIANCLRRMGENAEASNRFRKIASQPEAGWLSERAAWWVDTLEQIRKAESELKEAESNTQKNAPKSKLPISGSSKEASHDNHHH